MQYTKPLHHVTLSDGRRVKDRWLKWMRTVAYLLMATSGVLLLMSPFLTIIYSRTADTMAGFLVVGGTLSFIGSAFERWWGEYMGIPLLASSFMVFALISSAAAWDTVPLIAASNFCMLMSVALGLLSRWRDARAIYRLAFHLSERPSEEANE
jgi:hypothetical protein